MGMYSRPSYSFAVPVMARMAGYPVFLPNQLPRVGVQGIEVGLQIAKVSPSASDHHGVANHRLGLESPVEASGLRVDRIHGSVVAAGVDFAAYNGGLAVRRRGVGKAEGPLDLERGQLLSR